MKFPTRRHLLACATAMALSPLAFAQSDYPSKPITFVVPFAAGSATDQLARAIGQSITEQTKQPVVVENKGGASGMIAAQAVAKAPADGYTVLITTNTTHAANEHLYKKLSYDPVKDFAPLSGLGKGGQVLVVPASSPYQSVGELVAYAKANPGKLSFGSGSSSSRIAGEMLKQLAGVDILRSNHGPLVMEVNSSPGLEGIETTTGKDVAGMIIQYIEKNGGPHLTRTKGKG